MSGEPVPIPEEQIESVQKVLASSVRCTAHPFLKVGQRVRIHGGALDGIEGVLTGRNSHDRLVVSIEGIQRSLQINIDGYEVEAL
jgi:transcription antitermination factor NusG